MFCAYNNALMRYVVLFCFNASLMFRRCVVRISAETQNVLTEVIHVFPQSFQANDKIVPQVGHDIFFFKLFPIHCLITATPFDVVQYNVITTSLSEL